MFSSPPRHLDGPQLSICNVFLCLTIDRSLPLLLERPGPEMMGDSEWSSGQTLLPFSLVQGSHVPHPNRCDFLRRETLRHRVNAFYGLVPVLTRFPTAGNF